MALPPWRTGSSAAFTAVEARKTFGAGRTSGGFSQTSTLTMTPAPPPPPPPPTKTTFPDELKQYVARTFEECSETEKPAVEAELKRVITDAFNKKIVRTIDWATMPLPQERIRLKAESELIGRSPSRSPSSAGTIRSFGKFSINDKKRRGDGESMFDADDKKRARSESSTRPFGNDTLSQRDKEKRAQRFARDSRSSVAAPPWRRRDQGTPMEIDLDQPLVGRCMDLEKRYFRLTSAPDPDQVRPLHVLERTLELLKRKWRTEQNYSYICDQFKSLRQDLTVQHIKSDFTVSVYEIHARIALEKGDLGEYNQCSSQLANLYNEGFKGHATEFKAYRVLYLLHTCNRSDMSDLLVNLTTSEKSDQAVKHALQVRAVMAASNYHRLFRLYLEAPNMNGYLMDSFVARERIAALATICKVYRPDIDIRFLTEELGFESDQECVAFLSDSGADAFMQPKCDANGVPIQMRFMTAKAFSLFDDAKRAAFAKVDIRGQV